MNSSQRAFLLLGILFTGLSNAEIDYTYTTGIIGHNSIQPPPDTFLLIRKKINSVQSNLQNLNAAMIKVSPTYFIAERKVFMLNMFGILEKRNRLVGV